MLLIPFIENAFKHGTNVLETPFIKIDIEITAEYIRLFTQNKYSSVIRNKDQNDHGIGLVNVKRRLELLYPGRFDLKLSKDERFFYVDFKLNFDK
jgi:sensor histidine kinase YesM